MDSDVMKAEASEGGQQSQQSQQSQPVDAFMEVWGVDLSSRVYDMACPAQVAELLEDLRVRKEVSYARSWARRGVLGYWLGCICRQTDRIDFGFRRLVSFTDMDDPKLASVVVSIIGTLGDVANYALMGICMLAAMFPDAYQDWYLKVKDED